MEPIGSWPNPAEAGAAAIPAGTAIHNQGIGTSGLLVVLCALNSFDGKFTCAGCVRRRTIGGRGAPRGTLVLLQIAEPGGRDVENICRLNSDDPRRAATSY